MTEEEAKTKWCCGPKLIADQANAARLMAFPLSQPAGPMENGLCIGSACMAWRPITQEKRVLKDGTEPVPNQLYLRSDIAKTNVLTIGGYCGLAGK